MHAYYIHSMLAMSVHVVQYTGKQKLCQIHKKIIINLTDCKWRTEKGRYAPQY